MKSISKEVLLSLRGRQSASAWSERLGYKSNQISRWESGHSRFSWLDFLDLCQRLNFPVAEVFAEYEFHDKPENIEKLFFFLLPNKTRKEMAKACGVSLLTARRWVQHQSIPNAEVVLQLFTQSGTPLGPLLRKMLHRKKMTDNLAAILKVEEENISAMIETPWTIAIACQCLHEELVGLSFPNSLRQISKKLHLDQKILIDTVHRLIRARLLAFSESENRFYLPDGPAHFEFRNSYLSFVKGAQFWMKYSLAVLDSKKTPALGENHVSYLVFNLQSSEIKRVHEKIIALYKEIADLSQENEKSLKCDRTFSFCMLLNRVEGAPFGDLVAEN